MVPSTCGNVSACSVAEHPEESVRGRTVEHTPYHTRRGTQAMTEPMGEECERWHKDRKHTIHFHDLGMHRWMGWRCVECGVEGDDTTRDRNPRVPTLDETIAEIREAAEGFKGIPFMPEGTVDAMVEQNIAMAKVIYAGMETIRGDAGV